MHAAMPAGAAGAAIGWGITGAIWHVLGAALAISACYGRLKYL
jgi:hypothetical protein